MVIAPGSVMNDPSTVPAVSIESHHAAGVPPPKQRASTAYGFASANFGSPTASMLFRDGAAAGRYDNATGFPGRADGEAALLLLRSIDMNAHLQRLACCRGS